MAVFFGSLSCWKTHPWTIFSALTEERRLSPKISWYMATFILPSIRWSRPVPLAEKHPQSIRFPPQCFTAGMVFLGLYSAFLFLQTRRVELMPNSSILVSSDHITSQAFSGSSRFSLANFRRACIHVPSSAEEPCARSRILILHGVVCYWWFSSCLWSQLPSGPGLIPDLSHHHWYPTRQDLAWSPRPREIGGDFVTVVNFPSSCLLIFLYPIPALCRSTILSLMSLDSSFVLPMVETLECDWLCGQVCFIQLHNDVTSWHSCFG